MDVQQELNRAKEAANSGNGTEARLILKRVIDQDPRTIEAWAMLAEVVTQPEHAVMCFERILKLDPGNEAARRQLAVLQGEPVSGHVDTPVEGDGVALQPAATEAKTPAHDAPPSPHARRARKTKSPRSKLELFLIVALGISACCVLALLIVPFDSLAPGNQAAQPAPMSEDSTAVIYENIRASNAEDIDLYMSTIHSKSPAYNDTRQLIETAFGDYDLSYRISGVEVIRQNERQAEVAFVLTTRKIRGPSFRDNRITGEMILRKENGVWKIYQQKVDQVEYLD